MNPLVSPSYEIFKMLYCHTIVLGKSRVNISYSYEKRSCVRRRILGRYLSFDGKCLSFHLRIVVPTQLC